MLLTDLKVREKVKAQKAFFPNLVFGLCKFFFGKQNYQYPNSNSPSFGPIVKKHFGSFFHNDIAGLA